MALVNGSDYDHIDLHPVSGGDVTRHMFKDAQARQNVGDLKSATNREFDFVDGELFTDRTGDTEFEIGRLVPSSGAVKKDDTLSTKSFITKALLPGSVAFRVESGYKYYVYAYDQTTGDYIGAWNGTEFAKATGTAITERKYLSEFGDYNYKIMVRNQDETVVAASDFVYAEILSSKLTVLADKIIKNSQQIDMANEGLSIQSGTAIAGYISASNGHFLTASGAYKTKYYNIVPKRTYTIKGNGDRMSYGLFNSLANETIPKTYAIHNDAPNAEYVITNDSGAKYLIVYYQSTVQPVEDVDVIVISTSPMYNELDSRIDEAEKYIVTGEAEISQGGNDITAYIMGSNGRLQITTNTAYRAKFYPIVPGGKYKIENTGNRLIYGLYDSLETDTLPVMYVNANETPTDTQHITNLSAAYLIVYYNYNGDADATCDVSYVAEKSEEKRHLNICVFGNSYAADSWGYAPFILKKYGITVNLYMYYRGSGSIRRLVEEWTSTSDDGQDIYGNNHIRRMMHIDTRSSNQWDSPVKGYSPKMVLEIANDPTNGFEWDIITLQGVSSEQYSDGEGGWTRAPGLEPWFRQAIDLIRQSYTKKSYQLGFFTTYNRCTPIIHKGVEVVPVSALDDRIETLQSDEAVWETESFNFVIPVGAAVFSARTNADLKSTAISDVGDLFAPDRTHLQEGVPCYMAACTVCQALFNKFFPQFSVMNEQTRILSGTPDEWRVPAKDGTVKEVGELYYELAQKCAIAANNRPFDITPIYSPSDTTPIIYNREKYWADQLIETPD